MHAIRRICGAVAWLLSAVAGFSHSPSLSSFHVDSAAAGVQLTLQLAPPDLDGDGRISADELAAGESLLRRLSPNWIRLTSAGKEIPVIPGDLERRDSEGILVWHAKVNAHPAGVWKLELTSLDKLPAGHREFVAVAAPNRTITEALLSAATPSLEINWGTDDANVAVVGGAAPGRRSVGAFFGEDAKSRFLEFTALGIEHILTGYDHLLYLAGLIVVCRRFRSILPIVTSFTVAHSITLALATVGAVALPSRIVEPAIAASIVFVGVENLLRRGGEPRWRWLVAFAFGLIHGFGFAGALREAGVGASGSSVVVPLFSFNLGVELGQLGVVCLSLPLLYRARQIPRAERLALPAISALVVIAGAYWFTERVWF